MAKKALCIGINDYPGIQNDLSGCVNDVQDWTKVLESRGFTVRQLLDRSATKSAMVAEIERLIGDGNPGDSLVFQYSGHGSWVPEQDGDEPDGRDEVLCPSDVGQNSVLTDDELYDLFATRKAGVNLVFLSDSCHSGSVSRAPRMVLRGDEKPTKSRFLDPRKFLPPKEAEKAMLISHGRVTSPRPHQGLLISGCQDLQTSADAWFEGRANGAFTYFAIKALKDLPANATYRQWHSTIRSFLPNASFEQEPNLFGTRSHKDRKVLE
ncbi:MAG TPA: caspase family protein [Phycisphaerae bacterium]|nr:caspase family protein [Phycisphaerae bacterium]